MLRFSLNWLLITAATTGDLSTVQLALKDTNVNINYQDESGCTALIIGT